MIFNTENPLTKNEIIALELTKALINQPNSKLTFLSSAMSIYEKALKYLDKESMEIQECEMDKYNKVIDEFIERLEKHERDNWVDFRQYGITWADINMIAKQMKGEK